MAGYETEDLANKYSKLFSKMYGKYYSTFQYKGKWYLTDCYN